MSIEPICDFCFVSTKGRCRTLDNALTCQYYKAEYPDTFTSDFGFTFADEEKEKLEEAEQAAKLVSDEIKTLKRKNRSLDKSRTELYNAIIPFLNNLSQNPEKPTIHWPNRAEKIKEFKAHLDTIMKRKS